MLAKQKSTAQIGFYNTFEEQLNHSHPLLFSALQHPKNFGQ